MRVVLLAALLSILASPARAPDAPVHWQVWIAVFADSAQLKVAPVERVFREVCAKQGATLSKRWIRVLTGVGYVVTLELTCAPPPKPNA